MSKRHPKREGSYVREFIFGFNDGLVSTLALVAGLTGAVLQGTSHRRRAKPLRCKQGRVRDASVWGEGQDWRGAADQDRLAYRLEGAPEERLRHCGRGLRQGREQEAAGYCRLRQRDCRGRPGTEAFQRIGERGHPAEHRQPEEDVHP